jgi:hypothetical protein
MTEVQLALLVLALLFIKHWFADFVVQFDYMVQEKGMYGANGGVHHMLIHMILTYIIVWLLFDPTLAILVATVDGLVHYHIDWLKMNISRWRGLTIKDWEFWMWLGADQLAHALTYLALVLWLISNKLT